MIYMKFELAKQKAINKWSIIVSNPLIGEMELPRCTFCQQYAETTCSHCPVHDTRGVGCCYWYFKWVQCRDKGDERWARYYAKKMLEHVSKVERPDNWRD